jgi:hypothetical protein
MSVDAQGTPIASVHPKHITLPVFVNTTASHVDILYQLQDYAHKAVGLIKVDLEPLNSIGDVDIMLYQTGPSKPIFHGKIPLEDLPHKLAIMHTYAGTSNVSGMMAAAAKRGGANAGIYFSNKIDVHGHDTPDAIRKAAKRFGKPVMVFSQEEKILGARPQSLEMVTQASKVEGGVITYNERTFRELLLKGIIAAGGSVAVAEAKAQGIIAPYDPDMQIWDGVGKAVDPKLKQSFLKTWKTKAIALKDKAFPLAVAGVTMIGVAEYEMGQSGPENIPLLPEMHCDL